SIGVLGDSLRSIRFVPALVSSATVVLTAMIAREFGGRRFALALSAVTILVAPIYLSAGSLLTTNYLEPLLWMVCAYLAIPAIKADGRDVALSPWQYFSQQILLIHPLSAPIWITGLVALFASPRLKPYRLLGWCYLVVFALFVVLKGKNYYLAPIYPMLLAAGAVMMETGIERSRQGWLKPAMVVVLLAAGAWLAPLIVPVLPVEQFISYMNNLPFKVPRSEHSHMAAVLPQHYADQFGW